MRQEVGPFLILINVHPHLSRRLLGSGCVVFIFGARQEERERNRVSWMTSGLVVGCCCCFFCSLRCFSQVASSGPPTICPAAQARGPPEFQRRFGNARVFSVAFKKVALSRYATLLITSPRKTPSLNCLFRSLNDTIAVVLVRCC